MLLGRFCRILLPILKNQYSLTREETRLFVLMNVPLRYLNYHRSTEKLIQQFCTYPNILNKVFLILIFRVRTKQDLKDFDKLFTAYLKTYQILITLVRDYDRERKRKARSNEIPYEQDETINSLEGSEDIPRKSKNNFDNDREDDVTDQLNYETRNKDKIQNEDELTVKPTNQNIVTPNFREEAIRQVEVNELLDVMKFDNIEKEIILLKMNGLTLDEIIYMLGLKISKQSISKKLDKIEMKFYSEFGSYEKIYQVLMD